MSVDVAIARIRAYAHQKRWSKSRLAIEAGMTDTVLRRFDHRDWNPAVGTLRRLETLIPPEFEPYEREVLEQAPERKTPSRPSRRPRPRVHADAPAGTKQTPAMNCVESHRQHVVESVEAAHPGVSDSGRKP